jgi:2-polyprenyl-3-methyl-5-hydroxy-6-metoxy-1,4-benzoquinol methylase
MRLEKIRQERWKEYGVNYARDHEKSLDNWEYREIIHLLKPRKNDRILDIGCNTGEFCNLLKEGYGCNPKGIDINEEAIRIARIEYPELPFEIGDVGKRDEMEEYDGITMIEVIEHLRNLPEVISKVKHLLKPDGRFVLSTPNKWAVLFRLKSRIFKKDIMYDPLHVREFSPKSLRRLLSSSGMRVDRMYTRILGVPLLRHISPSLYLAFPSAFMGRFLFCVARKEL